MPLDAAMTEATDGSVGWVLSFSAVTVFLVRFGRGEAGKEGGSWETEMLVVAAGSGGGVVFSFVMMGVRIANGGTPDGRHSLKVD